LSKTKIARSVTALLAILVVVSGVAGVLHYGGICSLDVLTVSATSNLGRWLEELGASRTALTFTCPLGFLERTLASRELLPSWWFSAAVAAFSVILLGRVFCAWICPAGLLHRVFRSKKTLGSKRPAGSERTVWPSYSSIVILGGVLFASFWFRFPVFCFFCPIGLFFGAVYAGIRLFSPDPPSLELVLFPVMLIVELWVLRSWCRSICPLGALLSIIGNLNHILVPVVNKKKCRTSQGIACGACEKACPEGIDLTKKKLFVPNSCTKCLECSNRCPAKAIEFRLVA
jgi:ferredoxin-type protein NapH